MASASQAERVQVVVRGQRFESTVEILSAYCVFFRCFFREAREKLTVSNDVEGVDDDWWACHAAATRALQQYLQRPVKDGESVVCVASIEFDRATSRWRFVYTAKTLALEDVGVVLVYIRKLFRWSQQQQDQEREPRLPIRWDEMTYDAQLALARVVCSFGVEPLVGRFDIPTAPLGHGAGTKADPVLLRHMAEAYMQERLQREESLDAGAAQEEAAETATGAGGDSRLRQDLESDDLVLAAAACSRCGITGHTDVDCPH
ncbi:hypothetical protein TRSC58_03446 [Trypanosoma rangeli SC58]|uniref:CCHC-type domain-containing protein n=1 Tax=Trypanosoma rangeli SC58 TaxID=429131 RepID=A0A061J3D1_TRYRA|nr:hypothetical protein TRSC58_03446 [Trypanosoma rangeli SC58]